MKSNLTPRKKIHLRIRKAIKGTSSKPRLTVFRSNKEIYCQLIDDLNGQTLVSSSSKNLDDRTSKTEVAKRVGLSIAEKAKSINVDAVVFDRSGYLYHGRIKALAEGAREGGLQF
jgi:large subunit ribosomal protein L18